MKNTNLQFERAHPVEIQKNRPKQDLMKFLNVAKMCGTRGK